MRTVVWQGKYIKMEDRRRDMKRNTKQVLSVAVLFLLLLTIGCSQKKNVIGQQRRIPVKTVRVEQRDIAVPIHSSGRLYPKSEINLSFKTGGIIERLYVDEGQSVTTGTQLAALDLSEIKAQHSQTLENQDRKHLACKSCAKGTCSKDKFSSDELGYTRISSFNHI